MWACKPGSGLPRGIKSVRNAVLSETVNTQAKHLSDPLSCACKTCV